jgi:ribonuclease-3
MGDSDLVVIFTTHSDIEANVVRGLLEAHGVPSVIAAGASHPVSPLTADGLGQVRLSVDGKDADEARRIIELHRGDAGRGQLDRGRAGFEELESRLGYRFKDRDLLECALTHRSRANEDETGAVTDNESLEFLGDSVLGFLVAERLYQAFPDFDEGQKSKMKASLVSTTALARLARHLDLGEYLALGRGEEKTGGRRKRALLADGYEALIAAVYLDGGIDAARDFIAREFGPAFSEMRQPAFSDGDHKSRLQEYLQARDGSLPEYLVVAESGPDHRKVFQVDVAVAGEVVASASGRKKKDAEQEAARRALARLCGEVVE